MNSPVLTFKHFSVMLLLPVALVACGDSGNTGSTEIPVATAPATTAVAAVTGFADQADAGAALYATNCAACHGANLEGTTLGPLLSGFSWVQRWGEQTPALLLGNIQANMPPGGSDNLSGEDYLNIVAHILNVNGVDSVEEALTASTDFEIADNISAIVAQQQRVEPPPPQGLTVAGNTEDYVPFVPLTDAMLEDPSPNDWPMHRRDYYAHSYLSLIHI